MNTTRFDRLRLAAALMLTLSMLVTYIYAGDNAQAASSTTVPATQSGHSHGAPSGSLPPSVVKQVAFRNTMRQLWEDHITWTRLFIVSAAAGLPDTTFTAERLLRNQTDIGNAIRPFYGDVAGAQLEALLRDHIMIAADLLTAAKAGDADGVADANTRWYANADDIAAFLHAANPDHWPLAEMEAMMRSHLDLTIEEAVARLHGDWAADIAAYDQVHQAILEMADMLSTGIIQQFPRDFR